jgi:3-oxoacyl-[acyl-carrier protein] reductase
MTLRAAFISGSGRNIGRAIALKLAQAGLNIVLNGRADDVACCAVADEVRAHGVEAHVLMGDVGDAKEAKRLAATSLERFGTIDVLVKNVDHSRNRRVSLGFHPQHPGLRHG